MTAETMRATARALLAALDDEQGARARYPYGDDAARCWLEYRPRERPGACIADFDRTARKAAHRLLATALSPHAYAQAMAIVALEEVLDRAEGWERGRHSDDYWVAVFGDPAGDDRWGWRFEGHHVSVSVTVDGDAVSPAPVFLGANPAGVRYAGRTVLRPLAAEEDLARTLLDAMGPAGRSAAVLSGEAPDDLLSAQLPRVGALDPPGVAAHRLGPTARALLDELVALYLSRLAEPLAVPLAAAVDRDRLTFAWAGGARPGDRHYYRIQAPDLLVEYDNTQDGANHAHTVLRRPDSDFGAALGADAADPLRAHRADAHRADAHG
jgi:Protein of unknown function (DUF3500)